MIDELSIQINSARRPTSSTKPIHYIFNPDNKNRCRREGLVIKTYSPKNTEATQSALNEIRARRIGVEIVKTLNSAPELKEHLPKIHLTNAFANFDSEGSLPFVSDFFDGEELNFDLAKRLPIEIRAVIVFLAKALGINQFPTSSIIVNKDLEVGIIDLETAFCLDKPDITTENCLSLFSEASKREGRLDYFNYLLNTSRDLWFEKLEAEGNSLEEILTTNQESLPNTFSPIETIETLKTLIADLKKRGFNTQEEIPPATYLQNPLSPINTELVHRLIDEEKTLTKTGNDISLLLSLCPVFCSEMKRILEEAEVFLRRNDYKSVKRAGHSIKGSVQLFCREGSETFETALALEKAGSENDYTNADRALKKLNELLPEFCRAVNSFAEMLKIKA